MCRRQTPGRERGREGGREGGEGGGRGVRVFVSVLILPSIQCSANKYCTHTLAKDSWEIESTTAQYPGICKYKKSEGDGKLYKNKWNE